MSWGVVAHKKIAPQLVTQKERHGSLAALSFELTPSARSTRFATRPAGRKLQETLSLSRYLIGAPADRRTARAICFPGVRRRFAELGCKLVLVARREERLRTGRGAEIQINLVQLPWGGGFGARSATLRTAVLVETKNAAHRRRARGRDLHQVSEHARALPQA